MQVADVGEVLVRLWLSTKDSITLQCDYNEVFRCGGV